MTLRHRLSLLVAIALIPPLLLMLYNVVRSQVVLDKQVRGEMSAAAQLIAADLVQLIDGGGPLRPAMSKHPAVPGDEAACTAYFRSGIADIPLYRAAAIVDSDGGFHCSTFPTPPKVTARDLDYFREPLTTGRFATAAAPDRATEALPLHVSTPYRTADGALKGVILLALDPERLAQELESRSWRPPQRAMVLDRDGSLVLSIPRGNGERAKAIAE